MPVYLTTITYITDRELTDGEVDALNLSVIVQVAEPVDTDGDDVEYETSSIHITTTKVPQ